MFMLKYNVQLHTCIEKKEEIRLSPMTKAPTPTENPTNATKNFNYATILDGLRTVIWGNDSHQTGVVKPVYGIPTSPLTAKAMCV